MVGSQPSPNGGLTPLPITLLTGAVSSAVIGVVAATHDALGIWPALLLGVGTGAGATALVGWIAWLAAGKRPPGCRANGRVGPGSPGSGGAY